VSAERLWWLALAAIAAALGLAITTGPTNLTTAAAFVAFALVVLAALVDKPPPEGRRRPW
jgi:hypothetical protein